MRVGIVGLGLIGGSFAKVYKQKGHTVYVCNRTKSVAEFAVISEVADGILDPNTIPLCDLIIITVYPESTVQWLEDNKSFIKNSTFVIDCCGVKEIICDKCFSIASECGFEFVGGHPMAGTQYSGYKYSFAELFEGAPMVIVPKKNVDMLYLQKVKELLSPAGFGKISVTDAATHDKIIGYTSQLAHVVSNAFIKSPTAQLHKGFSAGSYKDLTRVAELNATMWTELFMDNKENLIEEIDVIVSELEKYKLALIENNSENLKQLLQEGSDIKKGIDG